MTITTGGSAIKSGNAKGDKAELKIEKQTGDDGRKDPPPSVSTIILLIDSAHPVKNHYLSLYTSTWDL